MPSHIEHAKERLDRTSFGFWVYLMTDLVLFASLFAAYGVLHANTNGGASGRELFSLPYVLLETLALLSSSFTIGLALLSAQHKRTKHALFWLVVTFALGTIFLTMELHEFRSLVADGNSWRSSAFLSSFFTLVGTHGAHITVGLLWIAIMAIRIAKQGMTESSLRRLTLLSLFWHFLDIVWIFIFSMVYLLGVAS